MHPVERVVVHVLLAALVVAVLLDRPIIGSSAEAEPARAEEVLGPADRLVLLRDGDPVDVTAVEGGLAWGEGETTRTWSLGAVDVPKLLATMMDSTRFAEDRRALQSEAEEQGSAFEERIQAFREEFGPLKPEDPGFQEAQTQWQGLMEEYQRWQRGTMTIQQKLGAEQIEEAYRELVEAVDIVAEREGVEIVVRFVDVEAPFNAPTIDVASDQIRRRLLLHYPDAIDLTSKVSDELGL